MLVTLSIVSLSFNKFNLVIYLLKYDNKQLK